MYSWGRLKNAAKITSRIFAKYIRQLLWFSLYVKAESSPECFEKKISYRKAGCSVFRNYDGTIVKVG